MFAAKVHRIKALESMQDKQAIRYNLAEGMPDDTPN
jgi:hypothetical protein